MLTTIAKRIQSRLSRLGVKVSLSEIKTQCEETIKDIETPTEEELLAVQEYFLATATQLTVINDDIASIDSINTASIQELDNQEGLAIAPQNTQTENTPAPLATTTNKGELVANTADQMGIVLNTQEISLIAENINNSSDDFEQDIDAIKSAIMAFVQHKAMINQSKINSLINEVREVVGTKNQENSQLLSDGLKQINSDIQEANRAFKSNVRTAIAAFELPAFKAG